ncbi:MAG TPA: aminoglycoside phosphotransferase family protein [Ramlibacter sp.]|nr:aminoglycoside phosphotransferase family protein [Ramlibacter sp.]
MTPAFAPDSSLTAFLIGQRLARPDETAHWHALAGGVSSDIWQVELPGRSVCVKRALPQLKVAAEWLAPVDRNTYEWAWMQFAARHCPTHVPAPLAHDEAAGLFAMSFLAPDAHPVWKQQLMAGQVVLATARSVGEVLGRLHAASARDASLPAAFETIDNFFALRLEPYLLATAARHPDLSPRLLQLAVRTAGTHHALVHGDVSPKNVLVGPAGPVLLDAECAWYGDPAFDLAFCLNHLLLKCLARPEASSGLLESFEALAQEYLTHVDWESGPLLEARAAELLPALMLARVDGKSPVEYLVDPAQKARVRSAASDLIQRPVAQLEAVAHAWRRALAA